MIKKLDQLKSFLRELKENQLALRNGQQEIWATQKLQSLFPQESFIPQTSWSLQPQAILYLLNVISIKKPRAIIEFGSGATTLYIAKLLEVEKSEAVLISIESDQEWQDLLATKLKEYGLDSQVRQVYAPIEEVDEKLLLKEQKTWYSPEAISGAIENKNHFDLVIVDGPVGGSTPYARYSVLPFLNSKTSENTHWFLDDTNRPRERQIIEEWQKQTGLNARHYHHFSVLARDSDFDFTSIKI